MTSSLAFYIDYITLYGACQDLFFDSSNKLPTSKIRKPVSRHLVDVIRVGGLPEIVFHVDYLFPLFLYIVYHHGANLSSGFGKKVFVIVHKSLIQKLCRLHIDAKNWPRRTRTARRTMFVCQQLKNGEIILSI